MTPDTEATGREETLFPTEQWLEAYGRALDESEALDDLGTGWGEGFDGDVVYVIEDLPLAEARLGDLPEELLAGLPDHVRERVADVRVADVPDTFEPIREALPASVRGKLDQLESHVHDGTVHARICLEDGACTGVEILDEPDAADAGFVLRGPYETWKEIVDGRPSAAAVLSGDLAFEGDRLKRLRYSAMFQLLGDVAADVETTHLFETGDGSSTPLLDTAMRGRMYVQRHTRRRAKLAIERL
jgi:putative sterol carrier protein